MGVLQDFFGGGGTTVVTKQVANNTIDVAVTPQIGVEVAPAPVTVNVDNSAVAAALNLLNGTNQQILSVDQAEESATSTGNIIQVLIAVAGLIGLAITTHPAFLKKLKGAIP
jgi:hypothetical protein